MQILAIDLGKFKSLACDYDTSTAQHTFTTIRTTPQTLHDLFAERSPDRVVIEIGSAAGWIRDLCEAMELDVQIANPNHEAWRWKNIKRKTDKDDALKLAQLSVMNQSPTINLPGTAVRQWRSLIGFRWTLVRRHTAIKNRLPIPFSLLLPTLSSLRSCRFSPKRKRLRRLHWADGRNGRDRKSPDKSGAAVQVIR